MVQRIDDALSVRDGRLFIEERDTVELVREFGSPLFVISEDHLRRRVRAFAEAFGSRWAVGPVKVMPAVKANWVLAVQHVLASEGCGADIYSPGELDIALRAGIDPAFISVNGVPKSAAHVRRAVEVGARLTIDSERPMKATIPSSVSGGPSGSRRSRERTTQPRCGTSTTTVRLATCYTSRAPSNTPYATASSDAASSARRRRRGGSATAVGT